MACMPRASALPKALAAACLLSLVLAGCSMSKWAPLEAAPQTSDDKLPPVDSSSDEVVATVDSESLRLQWASPEVSYYSAHAADDPFVGCLVVYESGEVQAACSPSMPLTVEDEHGTVALGVTVAGDDWEQLSEFLWRQA